MSREFVLTQDSDGELVLRERGGHTILAWFLAFLTLSFIILKLVGVINWSWWWVLAPMWIPMACGVCIVLILLGMAVVITILD
jgi:hypothetical protein